MAVASMRLQNPFTNLWNRAKSQKAQVSLLWCDLDIPAKLFYKITESGATDLLVINGLPTAKDIEKAWYSIIDMVFEFRKDARSQNIQMKQVKIAVLNQKIKAVEMILTVLFQLLLTEKQQNELINTLKRLKIKINNVDSKDLKEEIRRVLTREVGGLRGKLKIEADRLKEMQKGISKKVEYERICLRLSRAIDLKLDINMTLGEFLAAEAEAIEISNKTRKNG